MTSVLFSFPVVLDDIIHNTPCSYLLSMYYQFFCDDGLETPSLVSATKWAVGIRTDTINFGGKSFCFAFRWKCEFFSLVYLLKAYK